MHMWGKNNYLPLDEKLKSEWNWNFKRLTAEKRLLENKIEFEFAYDPKPNLAHNIEI